ncbi:MAG: hypothetical protein HOB33_12485 [Bacteroidetes Order II. Incertae sedis bacterium]|jgi:large-conductance mechanosensitive channel|nr:hypothetical protein [Bacteroidetes Order II. bacterium]MBT6201553.1 hypothetical protein [Bacteroidetes Order II. bacterium]MBT6424543.1 hypothetical protein [Bacteroidetes Order II. bacterium]MBT6580462.1 hypothetical protein [Bacteroidetes Order II. bacterium]MBT6599867.1 hypothetical protein [Bacteroidetes Order II. bacterium]
MFILLLGATFVLAVVVSFIIAKVFQRPVQQILDRIIADQISYVWSKYLSFAIYVVGVSGGVRVWELEKYLRPQGDSEVVAELTTEAWVLEIYGAIIGTMSAVAWMLLVFFVFTLIAFVIVRGREMKQDS